MRILLIDDDHDDQTLFCEAVNQLAGEEICDTASDGLKGLEFLSMSDKLPDVVFLDINMPVMDGRETLNHIRSNPRYDDIRIVIYSTSNYEKDISWFNAMNVKYMVKPTSFPALITMLKKELMDVLFHQNKLIIQAC